MSNNAWIRYWFFPTCSTIVMTGLVPLRGFLCFGSTVVSCFLLLFWLVPHMMWKDLGPGLVP